MGRVMVEYLATRLGSWLGIPTHLLLTNRSTERSRETLGLRKKKVEVAHVHRERPTLPVVKAAKPGLSGRTSKVDKGTRDT